MKPTSRIYIAGHRGLVGSAIKRRLESDGCSNIVTRTHSELDLTDQRAVAAFYEQEKPEYVFLSAAKVGGILANATYPAEFIYQNIMIQTNVIHQSYVHGVRKLLFLGSSCIYPKQCPQPMKEEYLMTGPLEPTNSPYAVAKISGIEMCWAYNRQYGTCFIPVMPTNLYGPHDNFDLETSHVLPALLRKFHEGKESSAESVTVWGTGNPRREFLYADDLADACVQLLRHAENRDIIQNAPLYNIGTGCDVSIKELAGIIKARVGFNGRIDYDSGKPDGTPQKWLDVSRMRDEIRWQAKTSLGDGIESTYQWYKQSLND